MQIKLCINSRFIGTGMYMKETCVHRDKKETMIVAIATERPE